MITGTPTDSLLDEAEEIVRAEWMRLQFESGSYVACAKMRAVRVRGRPAVVTAVVSQPGAWRCADSQPLLTRYWPRRVWPSQRSPPNQKDPDTHVA